MLARLVLAIALVAGAAGWVSSPEAPIPHSDREIDALLVMAVEPGVTLDRFSGHFVLAQAQVLEGQGFSLVPERSYPSLEPGLGIEQAIFTLRAGSTNLVRVARFILADEGSSTCTNARAFADRHALLAAAPLHPEAIAQEDAGRIRYTGRINDAQVSATTRPHSDCLHEIFAWHRYGD